MLSKQGIKNIKRYCREPIENIKGYKESVESEGQYDCHHINELTFTRSELIKMNMYYHRPASELLIIPHSSHMKLHRRHDMASARYGEKAPMYGRTGDKAPMYGRTGDKAPMYGRCTDNSPNWKGNKCSESAKYMRALKLYKAGKITDEEFQPYRDAWAKHMKLTRGKK